MCIPACCALPLYFAAAAAAAATTFDTLSTFLKLIK